MSKVIGISGQSRDGRPLSYNRAPAADLAPWIARLFVAVAYQPEDQKLSCSVFNDTVFLRSLRGERLTATTPEGEVEYEGTPIFFGPHTRRMKVSVTGPISTYGLALRPGACAVLNGPSVKDWLDRLAPLEQVCPSEEWKRLFDPNASLDDPEDLLADLEERFRELVAASGSRRPADISARFDDAAFRDPAQPIGEFAERVGIDMRTLQRAVLRDFGMAPKQVMRRARALDMASQLVGFADIAEAEEHLLRFHDQSHLIHDFKALFGVTPREFAESPDPLLALALEARQARRLEHLGTLDGTVPAPWR